ncbi:ubiquitin-related modifier 1 homolog [Oppia nitens]|uniref:ubiquitin-related modifier 1 homolog n=1 Tax=Oppia nitens TaxID=1686743 RepID=UPI0023DA6C5C|nr:ubiquitin-related modifier 1 homolog [Oppia nitens]
MSSEDIVEVLVQLSGGTELLFGNTRQLTIKLDKIADKRCDLQQLIDCLKTDHLKERPELFVIGNTVRPGILVLVNDVDWELLGQLQYQLKHNDRVLFISTLHGG